MVSWCRIESTNLTALKLNLLGLSFTSLGRKIIRKTYLPESKESASNISWYASFWMLSDEIRKHRVQHEQQQTHCRKKKKTEGSHFLHLVNHFILRNHSELAMNKVLVAFITRSIKVIKCRQTSAFNDLEKLIYI